MDPNPQPPTPPTAPPVDPSQPAAGGWVPTPMQQAMGVGVCSSLMGFAPVCLEFPSPYGKVAAGLCAALATGLGVFLGLKSAGPRKGV